MTDFEAAITTDADTVTTSNLPGPYPVGQYAAQLKRRLQEFAHVQLVGEVWGFRGSRARVYFELRDARGAVPCSMWRTEFQALGLTLVDGMRVVVGGGCDYYPGSSVSSPSFTFSVIELRIEGEGDLLAALQRLRRQFDGEGLFEPQKRLARPPVPKTIGVVTGEQGKARDDVLAGLRRRGWAGRLVWAFVPVQDRHAAPRIAAALRELAAIEEVEVVIVARGGGSLADLLAFCDETLCRTVALLRTPVIASVGHHTDQTLIDDVAAVSCSTPTHAAEAAVRIDCRAARADLAASARQLERHGRVAVLGRARHLAQLSRAPAEHVARHRVHLHQRLREMRASARRRLAEHRALARTHTVVLERKAGGARVDRERRMAELQGRARRFAGTRTDGVARRTEDLERLALALGAHDPARTLARGYALIEDPAGEPVTTAQGAQAARELGLRFHDGRVRARVHPPGEEPSS
ncbi:MAG TPA: exodeoxyribonuclease VII large subunit [Solirubrobacteraceae bacterium]|jgi:exodeoxyribonuclease VII large subunit|nr:exodeoxyribonuclease VII large subunit [Solirubrobacteraceae bacterium]